MEMVSASKMSRAEEKTRAFIPYSEKMQEGVAHMDQNNVDVSHLMLSKRDVKTRGYIVITSDRGLAGAYNSSVLRHLSETVNKRPQSSDEYPIISLGRIGYEFCIKRNMPV